MGLKVKDLIDRNTMQWDRENIFYLLAHKTRMEIMSIPLQQNIAGRDVLIWIENQSQSFLVKSVAIMMKEQTQIEHSIANTKKPIWRKLWMLNVPLKVRMFLWHACANVLPTKENLNRRRIRGSRTAHCLFCIIATLVSHPHLFKAKRFLEATIHTFQ